MKYYDVWNAETGNLVASYRSEAEALELVRATIHAYGIDSVSGWSLLWGDDMDDDAGGLIAEGAALADFAVTSARVA